MENQEVYLNTRLKGAVSYLLAFAKRKRLENKLQLENKYKYWKIEYDCTQPEEIEFWNFTRPLSSAIILKFNSAWESDDVFVKLEILFKVLAGIS